MYKIKKRTAHHPATRKEMFRDTLKSYKEFILRILSEEPSKITNWIKENLVERSNPIKITLDREYAFFMAEKSLLEELIITNPSEENLQKAYLLITEFIDTKDHLTLARELDIISVIVNSNKEFFITHASDYSKYFQDIFGLLETNCSEVAIHGAQELLGNIAKFTGEITEVSSTGEVE